MLLSSCRQSVTASRAEEILSQIIQTGSLPCLATFPRGAEIAGTLLRYFGDSSIATTKFEMGEGALIEYSSCLVRERPELSGAIADLLSRRAIAALDARDIATTTSLYDAVITLRPDPDRENDRLRLRIVEHAKAPDSYAFAAGRLRELKEGEGVWAMVRFRLLITGYYGFVFPLALVTALVLVTIAAIATALGPGVFLFPFRLFRGKHVMRGYERTWYRTDEYTRLLELLGVSEDATNAEIKQAFRQLSKEYHPDTIRQQGAEANEEELAEKFMELKRAYERLQEIRKSRFFK